MWDRSWGTRFTIPTLVIFPIHACCITGLSDVIGAGAGLKEVIPIVSLLDGPDELVLPR